MSVGYDHAIDHVLDILAKDNNKSGQAKYILVFKQRYIFTTHSNEYRLTGLRG